MKKLMLCVALVTMFILVTPVLAQEGDDGIREALTTYCPQPTVRMAPASMTIQSSGTRYTWGIIFTYQATQANWWTGLAVTNIYTGGGNQINVVVFDGNTGQFTGEGTFYLPAFNAQRVDQLKTLVTSGYVPQRGAVYVYGTGPFLVSLLVGNNAGGFSMVDKQAIQF